MPRTIIIGIDGGGTQTRVMAAATDGQVLAMMNTGPANPQYTGEGRATIQQAIRNVVAQANCVLDDVGALVAGFAGLDTPDDMSWANELTALSELTCPRTHVSDAVVAHAGAFCGEAGVLAIAGTGTNVFAVTDSGVSIRNGDFTHYARAAAFHLASASIVHILAGDATVDDASLVDAVLTYWQVADVSALRMLGQRGTLTAYPEHVALVGDMAPGVTLAALQGSPLAQAICDQAAKVLALGIRLVGSCFMIPIIPVALTGSVARSVYMQHALNQCLCASTSPIYQIVEPTLPPVAGAVFLGLTAYHGRMPVAVRATLQYGM